MHNYYDDCDSHEYCYDCYNCEQSADVMQEARNHLDELVKRLYITDQTDILQIQIALDNLCDCLGVKTINGDINIEKKKPDYLDNWVDYNTAYLKSLANTQKAIGE